MKLPLSYRATFRMKKFYDYKDEKYHGAVLRGASAQGATTKDIQHDHRRDFIKFPSHESDLPGDDHGINHILDGAAKLVSPVVHADYLLVRSKVGDQPLEVQGGQPLGDQPLEDQGDARVRWVPGPRAIRGVPDDGPTSKDVNYSSGKDKGKDKRIKSESKPPVLFKVKGALASQGAREVYPGNVKRVGVQGGQTQFSGELTTPLFVTQTIIFEFLFWCQYGAFLRVTHPLIFSSRYPALVLNRFHTRGQEV